MKDAIDVHRKRDDPREQGRFGVRRRAAMLVLALGLGAVAVGIAGAGTLDLNADILWSGGDGPCPAGTPQNVECHPHPGSGAVRGLGRVTQLYTYPVVVAPADPSCHGYNVADFPASLIVQGKGEIDVLVKGLDDCLTGPESSDTVVNNTQAFTIVRGTGAYAGASGGGAVKHIAQRNSAGHAFGHDVWTATLVVPGLEFDLTPPTISGAANKTVLVARSARKAPSVRFRVAAVDAVDGPVAVSCKPRSGSRFKVGTTLVNCSATDKSANAATASFSVAVKRRS